MCVSLGVCLKEGLDVSIFLSPPSSSLQGHLSQYSFSSGACFSVTASVYLSFWICSPPGCGEFSPLSLCNSVSVSSVPVAQSGCLPYCVAWWPLTTQAGDYAAAGGGRLLIPSD